MHEAVEDGIGHGGIGDEFMPLTDWELTGDEGGTLALAIIEDFEQVPVLFARSAGEAEVIYEQERRAGQPFEQGEQAAVGLRGLQGAEQFGSK